MIKFLDWKWVKRKYFSLFNISSSLVWLVDCLERDEFWLIRLAGGLFGN